MDFCKCGSIQINDKCTNEHCPNKTQKHKDWIIDGKTMEFKKPVTFKDASELARKISAKEKNA